MTGGSTGAPDRPGQLTSILVIDDDPSQRRMVAVMAEAEELDCETAGNGAEAREQLGRRSFDLALCDIRMPGETGLELLADLRRLDPTMAVIMMSGEDDPIVAEVAIERGAYGYLVKPFERQEMVIGISNALHRRTQEQREARHRDRLEAAVEERTRELNATVDELRLAQRETVDRLARAVEARDAHTGGHIDRVGALVSLLAGWIGLDPEQAERLGLSAPMHDLGKIGVPDQILLKPGRLTDEERREMQRHTLIGYDVLQGSRSELLEEAATIALTHHERWDGGGYPRGLVGEEIPIAGRITALADVFDALLSDRGYRPAMSLEDALQVVRDGRGSHFDPVVVDALLEHLDEVLERVIAPAAAEGIAAGPAISP